MNKALTGHNVELDGASVQAIFYSLLKELLKSSGKMTKEGIIPVEKNNLVKMLQGYSDNTGVTDAMIAEAIDFIEKELMDEMAQQGINFQEELVLT